LAITTVQRPVVESVKASSEPQKQTVISQYVQFGTTCSAPTPYGFVPMCPMVAPMPLGSACWCTNTMRSGVVTW
jgi:hypothetical protein